MNIVILAAGDFPTHEVPLRALREADLVVCCDSAFTHLHIHTFTHSHIPFVVVGDGDSLPQGDKEALGDRWIQVAEQDYNDLHKAMQWVMNGEWRTEMPTGTWAYPGEWRTEMPTGTWANPGERRADNGELRISILGATGRREDHTLGNIGYLVTFAEEYPGVEIEMLTDYGRFVAMRGSRTFQSFPRQQVSIFSMDTQQPIYSDGLRWPLEGLCARLWWQATLNEALATEFSLRSEGWLVVFQTYEGK